MWRPIILSYARADHRLALEALLALDDTLATVVRSTREPMIGQMRLTWWHDALTALDHRPPPAEPVLRALADHVVAGVSGARLATLVEGWEELIDPGPLDDARLMRFADLRGGGLFVMAGDLVGALERDPLAAAGRGWALADLAANVSDNATRTRAAALAREPIAAATAQPWSRPARPLGALAHLADMPDASPPARAARALWHRLTGR